MNLRLNDNKCRLIGSNLQFERMGRGEEVVKSRFQGQGVDFESCLRSHFIIRQKQSIINYLKICTDGFGQFEANAGAYVTRHFKDEIVE